MITKCINLRWFQTTINHRILTINKLFFHMIDSPKCSFCGNDDETIDPLLWKCSKTQLFIQEMARRFQDMSIILKNVREKSRECHSHKPQPFPDRKRKRKPTNLNKHKPNKRTKSTKISSLFPQRGNRNTKRTEKHKNKMTHGKTYNKLPRRINHKATKSKTSTGTTALERYLDEKTFI